MADSPTACVAHSSAQPAKALFGAQDYADWQALSDDMTDPRTPGLQ